MRVKNTAGLNYSIELPGVLRPMKILPAGETHEVPDGYRECKQCQGLVAKGWLEILEDEAPAPKIAPVEETPPEVPSREEIKLKRRKRKKKVEPEPESEPEPEPEKSEEPKEESSSD